MTISTISIIKRLVILFMAVAGLYYAKDFLMPLSIGGILATLLLPLCKWFERRVPKGLAVLFCVSVLFSVIASIIALLTWQVAALTDDISKVKQQVIDIGFRVQEYIFNYWGITTERQLQMLKDEQKSMGSVIKLLAGSVFDFFTIFVLVLAYIFLFLYYRHHIKRFVLNLTPLAQQIEMEHVLRSITGVSQQYLLGLGKMIGCLWIMYGIGFTIIGVKNAFFFAILCGLLELVPFIGNITGTTLTLLVSAVQGASLPMLVAIVCTYGTVQFVQGWLLEPIILGPQVKINPFATVIALVLGGLLWGVSGIFLAIPLTAMLKILLDHIDSLKPFAYLIGQVETQPRTSKLNRWFKMRRHSKNL